MLQQNERIIYLLEAYTERKATVQEEQELMEWMEEAEDASELKDYARSVWDRHEPATERNAVDWNRMFGDIVGESKTVPVAAAPVRKINNMKRFAVAASILLVLASGAYFLVGKTGSDQPDLVQNANGHDVPAPTGNKAVITLANGQTVSLDSLHQGLLLGQGNIKLVKLADGQIAYQTTGGAIIKELQYNTLHNPRGSKAIEMTLADGSRVWLNSGSSLTYPVAFAGYERSVTLEGEGYFEVAKNPAMPFVVKANNVSVKVLGTHFNINAYNDEDATRITLLEGSVQVAQNAVSEILSPGQQAQVGSTITVVDDADLEEVMAWKNSSFIFNGAQVEYIMRQVGRWYNVDIIYSGNKSSETFSGMVSREKNVSEVLKILETGGIKFNVDGNKITVIE